MKKITKILVGLGSVLVVVGIATVICMVYQMNNTVKSVNEQVGKVNDQAIRTDDKVVNLEEEVLKAVKAGTDVAAEDDVVIMDQYKIESTKNISDAYINKDTSKLSERDKETLEMATKIIDEIIKDGMSDYEKELAVYEWLIDYTKSSMKSLKPQENGDGVEQGTPYGVLKYKSAVCVGYATTFRLFMQMLGIECKVVHSSSLVHSWDEVKLDDEWYYVDVYSDADGVKYKNFNLNDDTMHNSYEWNRDYFPAAVGVKYSYLYQNKIEADGVFGVIKPIKELVDDKDKQAVYIQINNYSEKDYPKLERIVSKITGYVNGGGYYSGNTDFDYEAAKSSDFDKGYDNGGYFEATLLTVEDNPILAVYYQRYNNEESNDNLDDETDDKIDKELSKVFGEADWDSLMNY